MRRGGRHPHVRVGRIAHAGAHGDALQLAREDVEHGLARDKRGRAERDGQRVARAVVVAARLRRALGHAARVEGRHAGRGEVVERGVDVPAVEAGDAGCVVRGRDGGLVEGGVGGVFERGGREALVVVDGAVADELDLGDARDGLEVWVEDGLVVGLGLVVAVAVGLGGGIERLWWQDRLGRERKRLCRHQVMTGGDGTLAKRGRMQYLCQRILLLWREICVSEEEGVVLEEDKIREHSMVAVEKTCRVTL